MLIHYHRILTSARSKVEVEWLSRDGNAISQDEAYFSRVWNFAFEIIFFDSSEY